MALKLKSIHLVSTQLRLNLMDWIHPSHKVQGGALQLFTYKTNCPSLRPMRGEGNNYKGIKKPSPAFYVGKRGITMNRKINKKPSLCKMRGRGLVCGCPAILCPPVMSLPSLSLSLGLPHEQVGVLWSLLLSLSPRASPLSPCCCCCCCCSPLLLLIH